MCDRFVENVWLFILFIKNVIQIHFISLLLINVSEVDLKNEAFAANASVSAHGKKV